MVGDEQIPTNSSWDDQHQQWINHVNLQPKDESLCCCSYCSWSFNRFNHVFRLEYIYIYTVDIPFKYRPPNGFINTTSKIYPRFDQHLYPHFVSWLKVFLFPLHSDQQVGGSYLVGDPDSLNLPLLLGGGGFPPIYPWYFPKFNSEFQPERWMVGRPSGILLSFNLFSVANC